MIYKKILIPILFIINLSFAFKSFAQSKPAIKYDKVKFGVIDTASFNVKPSGQDSAASAIVLFDIGNIAFKISSKGRWNYTFTRFKRIKILNKEGYKLGNFELPIYKDNSNEEALNKIQIASYNLINGKVIQNKAAKDERFKDNFDKNYTINKYTLSNVQEGSIIEIKYEIQSDFIFSLKDWYFQQNIPIVWSDFTLTLPQYFKYSINFHNSSIIKLINDFETQQNFVGTTIGSGVAFNTHSYNFTTPAQERRWVAENVPAFKDEPYITTEDDYLTKVDFELQSTNIPGEFYKDYSRTWENVADGYQKADNFGAFAKPNVYTKRINLTILKDGDDAFTKTNKIFNYVKTNIKWNKKNGDYSSQKSVSDVFETKSGNIGDINLTLLNLLTTAGLNAKPVVLSTRDNGVHPGYPSSAKFNYVIVSVVIDSTNVFLDASNKFYGINTIGINALSHIGLQMDLKNLKAGWISIDPKDISTTSITSLINIDKNLHLVGEISYNKNGYEALNGRRNFSNFPTEADYLKEFKLDKNGLLINKFKQENYNNTEETYLESFAFELADYVEEAGNLIYFNPILFERTSQNPFKQDTRSFPVDFAYPSLENYRVIINIPEGYVVDKLPTSIAYKLDDESASFLYRVAQSGNQVMINSKITLSKSKFEPENYNFIKELFKQIVSKQSQPLVLKKN